MDLARALDVVLLVLCRGSFSGGVADVADDGISAVALRDRCARASSREMRLKFVDDDPFSIQPAKPLTFKS